MAALDHGDIGAGPTHVHGDHVLALGQTADVSAAHHAAGRTRVTHARRDLSRSLLSHDAARGVHDQQVAVEAAFAKPGHQVLEIAIGHRLEVGVDNGGAGALELPDLREDVVGGRDPDVGEHVPQHFRCEVLVRGIDERVQEANGHGLDLPSNELRLQRLQLVGVEGGNDLTLVIHALGDVEDVPPRDQWVGRLPAQVIRVGLGRPREGQDVAEALGRHQRRLRALALEHRVGADRRAVNQQADVGKGHAELTEAIENSLDEGRRSRRHLADREHAGVLVHGNEVRERSSDIDSDEATHLTHPLRVASSRLAPDGPRGRSATQRSWVRGFFQDQGLWVSGVIPKAAREYPPPNPKRPISPQRPALRCSVAEGHIPRTGSARGDRRSLRGRRRPRLRSRWGQRRFRTPRRP